MIQNPVVSGENVTVTVSASDRIYEYWGTLYYGTSQHDFTGPTQVPKDSACLFIVSDPNLFPSSVVAHPASISYELHSPGDTRPIGVGFIASTDIEIISD